MIIEPSRNAALQAMALIRAHKITFQHDFDAVDTGGATVLSVRDNLHRKGRPQICVPRKAERQAGNVRSWHIALVRCVAILRPESTVERTCLGTLPDRRV